LNNSKLINNNSEFYENINQDIFFNKNHYHNKQLLEKDSSNRFSIGKSTERSSMITDGGNNFLSRKVLTETINKTNTNSKLIKSSQNTYNNLNLLKK